MTPALQGYLTSRSFGHDAATLGAGGNGTLNPLVEGSSPSAPTTRLAKIADSSSESAIFFAFEACVIEHAPGTASSVDRDPEVRDRLKLSDELGERPRTNGEALLGMLEHHVPRAYGAPLVFSRAVTAHDSRVNVGRGLAAVVQRGVASC